jgi:hypothetical protein
MADFQNSWSIEQNWQRRAMLGTLCAVGLLGLVQSNERSMFSSALATPRTASAFTAIAPPPAAGGYVAPEAPGNFARSGGRPGYAPRARGGRLPTAPGGAPVESAGIIPSVALAQNAPLTIAGEPVGTAGDGGTGGAGSTPGGGATGGGAGFTGGGGGGGSVLTPPGAAVPTDTETPVTPTDPGTPGAVPEPATWAMLILGMGFVGGMMRRRRMIAVRPGGAEIAIG